MRQFLKAVVLAATLASAATASAAEIPAYIGKRVSSSQDTAAIERVIEDFKAAIKTKNVKQLSSLMLNSNILFESPAPPDAIKEVRETIDTNFDGLSSGGYPRFAEFIKEDKSALEERFYNVKITQDGHLAWVMFDYEFIINNKPQNHGIETWQMMKTVDGKWKIASVMWTMNRLK